MELLIFFLFLVIWIFGIPVVFRAISSGTKATVKTIKIGGNLVDNFKDQYREMGDFEATILPTQVEISGKMVDAFEVKVRGLIKAAHTSELVLVTSLFDVTNGEFMAVMSSLVFFKEKHTDGFQNVVEAGTIRPNEGYINWIRVAHLYPETLTGTHRGKRKIRAFVSAMPPDQVPLITWGRTKKDMTIFSTATADVEIELNEKGWVESEEQRDLAKQLMVKIAVSVACADGHMHPGEGKAIQSWIKDQLRSVSDLKLERVKSELNGALKEAFSEFQNGELDQEILILKLKDLDLHSFNQGLLEFLVVVIGADEVLSQDEMSIIKRIGEQLGVDYDDIRAMSDKAFLEIGSIPKSENELEVLLGIDPAWDSPKILAHLRSEFTKWNGRIQALKDDEEREKAQKMLDAIATARQKYGAK